MAKAKPTLTLNPSRDIPLDRLELSQSNVRRVQAGVSIDTLAEDIARRGLLTSLNVRPILDESGTDTGRFEVPAGGRRYRALELLVKQKRLAKDAPVPCVVKTSADDILAEEDSLAENTFREPLHPLDEFRAMYAMVQKGSGEEEIAAHFRTTAGAVRKRLKLAGVSPKLHDLYADETMTLDQLMAFTVSDDHARQEEVWDQLNRSLNNSATAIRQKLTENSVRAQDKRVRLVGIDAYVAAGGSVVRDLFEADNGGWLTDPPLLDRLVDEKLAAAGETIAAEGWKWVATALDLPWDATRGLRAIPGEEVPMTDEEAARMTALESEGEELSDEWGDAHEVPPEVHARIEAIDAELGALVDRPLIFDPAEQAFAGAFVTVDADGSIRVERGFVKPEDEPVEDELEAVDPEGAESGATPTAAEKGKAEAAPAAAEDVEEGLKPISDRLVADLTAWRTLALQDAFAEAPETAYVAVLHAFVLGCFFSHSKESCVQISAHRPWFGSTHTGLRESGPGQSLTARAAAWKERIPPSDRDVWDFLLALDADERAALLAHCVSTSVNAHAEIVPKHGGGQVSAHTVQRRIAHSDILARAVGLDLVEAGWRPTVAGYFQGVSKARIVADVADARGEQVAAMIDHLKKPDMAREAERLLEDSGWLPVPLRTPDLDEPAATNRDEESGELPAFLTDGDDGDDTDLPVAAE